MYLYSFVHVLYIWIIYGGQLIMLRFPFQDSYQSSVSVHNHVVDVYRRVDHDCIGLDVVVYVVTGTFAPKNFLYGMELSLPGTLAFYSWMVGKDR